MSAGTVPDLMADLGVSFADEVDQAAESSGEVPPGKYHARQEGATLKDTPGQTPRWEVWFLILAGTYRGRKVKYTVWTESKDTDKDGVPKTAEKRAQDQARIRNELDHAYGVLGVKRKISGDAARGWVQAQLKNKPNLTADQIAKLADQAAQKGVYVPVEGKVNFRDSNGVECVIKTKLRPSSQEGDDRKFAEVEAFGVLAFNDPKAKGVVMATAQDKAAAAAAKPAASAADLDMGDLVSKV